MTGPLVAVLDYGIGNLHSAQKALVKMGADARLTTDPGLVADAAGVVLPGVGAFGACMSALRATGLESAGHDSVGAGRPL
ncbi:MAG: imidazole glycerol phosphate synthase subunit HisH, partial [Ilumatobacteraceae bacterium]